ncbi:MAG: DegQ family serine endoprotease [Rhodoblastus sp.]
MNKSLRAGLAALFGLSAIWGATVSGASAQGLIERVAPQTRAEALLSFSATVKKAAPAVVNVYASRVESMPRNPLFDDPVFRRFFGGGQSPRARTAQSLGSGVIVEADGLVVTNNHVIENMTEVKVAMHDHREFPAEIVLRDPRTDLAVLRLKGGSNLPALELGDSDTLEVGDLVLAIGNPFGVGQTVTQGIVSALARTQVGISDYGFFIQTDAAINPGNSGGALVDTKARLIGINSAIFSKSGGSVGIGFAIPVNMVKIVVATAKSGGKQVRRPWLGASLQTVSKEIADSIGLDRPIGALVADTNPKGPAAEAGLKRGDVIMAVDGQAIDDPEALGYRLGTKAIGGASDLSVLRQGKKMQISIKLLPAPETPARDPVTITTPSPFTGATLVNLSPATAEEYSVDATGKGVVVAKVEPDSQAAAFNFQRGDIVVAINDSNIETTRDLERAVGKRHYYWKVTINRGGQTLTSVFGG